jgi:hypothetical protein
MQTIQSNLGWIILIFLAIALFFYRKFAKDNVALTSKFKANQILPTDFNSSLKLVKQALTNADFSKVGFDADENRFYAQSGFSMSSWSEYIQVKVIELNNNTEIEFQSICAFPLQIFDWGKNRSNYRKFEKELKKLTSAVSA